MIRLVPGDKLQAVLSGAVATTQPQCVVCYSDQTSSGYSGGKQLTALNGASDVDILATPAAGAVRDVDMLSLYNRDTASVTVTVKYNVSATDSIITTVTLATLETLVYTHSDGWRVIDSSGRTKTTTTSADVTDNYAADGRLTLTSGTPILTSDVTGSTSIYYALYKGNRIALYDGSAWTNTAFAELTNTTTDNTKNPAAVANNSNYDLFVWNDSGTIRLGRGPAWSSDTSRGTGAGTTELERVNGILVNKIAITNGPGAQRGTYVGTVRSNGSATIDWKLGSVAANGGAATLYVWNMYNRVNISAFVGDSTNSWTTNSTAFRASNNSTSNRVSFVAGQNEDFMTAMNNGVANPVDAVTASVGLGYDSTTTFIDSPGIQQDPTRVLPCVAMAKTAPGLGLHFIQAVEASNGGANATGSTFYGDSAVTYIQSGIRVNWRA